MILSGGTSEGRGEDTQANWLKSRISLLDVLLYRCAWGDTETLRTGGLPPVAQQSLQSRLLPPEQLPHPCMEPVGVLFGVILLPLPLRP